MQLPTMNGSRTCNGLNSSSHSRSEGSSAGPWTRLDNMRHLATTRQMVVHSSGGGTHIAHFTHRLYEPLHYVLLFPYGEEG